MLKIFVMGITFTLASCGAYAACKPVTIISPSGDITVCQVCNDGKVIICN